MTEKILILDFGSQYTQLIARAVREANVYCEIIPYHQPIQFEPSLKGIILSGSPFSVNDANAPLVDIAALHQKLPVLGVCYGAQLTAKQFGGRVRRAVGCDDLDRVADSVDEVGDDQPTFVQVGILAG